jgi:hypothetical protein
MLHAGAMKYASYAPDANTVVFYLRTEGEEKCLKPRLNAKELKRICPKPHSSRVQMLSLISHKVA